MTPRTDHDDNLHDWALAAVLGIVILLALSCEDLLREWFQTVTTYMSSIGWWLP